MVKFVIHKTLKMYIEQLYTNCLAEAAYYIESNGEAAVIDPIREAQPYIDLAAQRGAKIKYVFETHFHADFISGHLDLAQQSGAKIVYGPEANTNYKVHNAADGEVFTLGEIKIKTLHTPGHTLESTCFLLLDKNDKAHALFTGDTLFVGDVGRPDLLDGVATKEELAEKMYDSLQKIKQLPDDLIIYPAHGPGSACGKNIGKETWTTLGQQKTSNYALLAENKAQLVEELINGLMPPPAYFFADAKINKEGYQPLENIIAKSKKPISCDELKTLQSAGTLVLDTRTASDFAKAHIPGAYNIGLEGSFAIWAASLLSINQPLVLVCEKGKEEEAIKRLARVGIENIVGYLEGGMESWLQKQIDVATITSISPVSFAEMLNVDPSLNILDVRKPGEMANGVLLGAQMFTLIDIKNPLQQQKIDKNKSYLIHCAGGYRSMIACSILKAEGFEKVINVEGGFGAIKDLPGMSLVLPEEMLSI